MALLEQVAQPVGQAVQTEFKEKYPLSHVVHWFAPVHETQFDAQFVQTPLSRYWLLAQEDTGETDEDEITVSILSPITSALL